MKMLVIMIDMVRTSNLNIYNPVVIDTPIDLFLKNLGGVTFTNVYTPCPDTYRSTSSFWSGVPCYSNGVN